ncbi:16S rRNA (cytosine(967)-C(5))-methyltransferase RsmB [Thermodesulfobacteriota bacterium]
MKKDKPRELALLTLNNLEKKGKNTGDYLDLAFKENPGLNARDRAFTGNLIQGVIRWKLRLDWMIKEFSSTPLKKINPAVLNILRLALYQIFFLDRVPESAAVDRAVEQAKSEKGHHHIISFVNGLLRNICRNKEGISFPDKKKSPVKYLGTFYSFPAWYVERLYKEFGLVFTEELLASQNRFPELNIRVNFLRTDREKLIKTLGDEGMSGEHGKYSPECILLKNFTGRIRRLSSFRKGLFQVQDQAAQIMAHLLNPFPGENILDVCAGVGGKTTHLVELMKGEGTVTALDSDEKRLEKLRENTDRLGLKKIKTVTADMMAPLSGKVKTEFDRILVDAPCSGLGTISRHPDIKWNKTEPDIKRMGRLQKKLLDNSAVLLKRGGLLLYAVCTFTREENKTVVDNFLRSSKEMMLLDLNDHVPEWGKDLIDNNGFFRSYPNKHNMDGFFAALFMKKKGGE